MRKLVLTIALVAGLTGCCTHGDYRSLLEQTRENLAVDIGPKYKGYLDADTKRPEKLRKNDALVLDDTVAAIDHVLSSSKSKEADSE
jgi:hypothetical protein